MRTTQRHRIAHYALLVSLLTALGAISSQAQFTFNSGSTGTNGVMDITTDTTLALPPHGQFHCTTITVASNATLKFISNELNTPVFLLATGDVTINGTIDVSGSAGTNFQGGAGGPGGFGGGDGANSGLAAGDGKGPGAGHAGKPTDYPFVGSGGYGSGGSSRTTTTNDGTAYGSPLLVPLLGGSGGGGRSDGVAGHGGGGAILIASNTRIRLQGLIVSEGLGWYAACQNFGLGSGGAIRLAAPVVAGTGSVRVSGSRNLGCGGSGGDGRIRIDCMDRRSLALNFVPSSVATIGANMVAIPANTPRLDIIQVAGTNIVVGTSAPVFFMLPQGASTNQTVRVQASNFGAVVPIRVVLTPDNGASSSYDTSIDNTAGPASVTVPVVVPVNVQVHVNAWTR